MSAYKSDARADILALRIRANVRHAGKSKKGRGCTITTRSNCRRSNIRGPRAHGMCSAARGAASETIQARSVAAIKL